MYCGVSQMSARKWLELISTTLQWVVYTGGFELPQSDQMIVINTSARHIVHAHEGKGAFRNLSH